MSFCRAHICNIDGVKKVQTDVKDIPYCFIKKNRQVFSNNYEFRCNFVGKSTEKVEKACKMLKYVNVIARGFLFQKMKKY